MQHNPTTRRWLLGTLWSVMVLTGAVTGVALWPMIHQWWVIRSLIQELTAAKLKENPRAVDAAQDKLGKIGRPAVPALLKLTRHSDAEARRKAIFALYAIDDRIEEAVPPVIDALRHDEDEHVRYASCWMLGKHGSAANGAVAALKDALNDESELIQMYAAGCLGRLGRDAESAVPALRERLRDESDAHCVQAWLALRELGRQSDPETINVLRELRKHGTASRRARADHWLHELGVPLDPGE